MYISNEYMLKPIFIRDFIPKHSYYTSHYINIISEQTNEVYHKGYKYINEFISNYLKENNIMRNEPYNNITIDEQIKINIIDIIFLIFSSE